MGNLIISEMFYSIQGEGQTMGIPAVFLRLAGCNILCKGEGWICDSIEVWKKGVKTDFNKILIGEYFDRLKNGAHLVVTGGEPLLHQKKLIEFFNWFKDEYDWLPTIEIETNGTILPLEEFIKFVDYWNCSPKLSSSGESYIKRFNDISLDRINKESGSIFKFVISSENDVIEFLNEYADYVDMNKVYFMPAGDSQESLSKTRSLVIDNCMKLGVKYCDRLHIVNWNEKTGV